MGGKVLNLTSLIPVGLIGFKPNFMKGNTWVMYIEAVSVVLGAGEVKSISVYTKREVVAPLAFH